MFYRILVAVNNWTVSEEVFEQALALAQATGAHLMLVNVLSPLDQNYLSTVEKNYYLHTWKNLTEKGLKYLYKLCQTATNKGVSVEVTQTKGNPGQIICQLASNWGADLIMVGRNTFNKFFLNTVSNHVLRHASCSVLIVQVDPAPTY